MTAIPPKAAKSLASAEPSPSRPDDRYVTGHLPGLLASLQNHYHHPRQFRYRRAGRWHNLSANAFVDIVHRLALGLHARGLQLGEHVALIGRPSPHWLAMDLAIQVAGGVTLPLFVDGSSEQLEHCLRTCSVRFACVDGEAGAETLHACDHRFDLVVAHYAVPPDGSCWQDYRTIMEVGDELAVTHPGLLTELIDRLDPSAVATVIFTSGSTGVPKGVPLTHNNLIYQVRSAVTAFELDRGDDRALSCLPLAHVFERMVCYSYLAARVPISFVDDIGNLATCLQEERPSLLTVVPRILEKVHNRIVIRASEGNLISKRLAQWAIGRAERGGDDRGWLHGIADRMLYGKVRDILGGRMRCVIVGGAPLRADIEAFFHTAGIPLYQGYGMTEAAPVITVNTPSLSRSGSVGHPFPGTDLRLADDGEILVRGPGVMQGYLDLDDGTIDADGWLHTGDLGVRDEDGFLRITGRKKHLLKTAGGKYVSPLPIEQALCRLPLVDRALVVAEGRPFVSALLFLDPERLQQLKTEQGSTEQSDEDFLAQPTMRNRIEQLVISINDHLDHWQQVRQHLVLTDVPTVDNGLLTATQKLRRGQLLEHYADEIDAIYEDKHREAS